MALDFYVVLIHGCVSFLGVKAPVTSATAKRVIICAFGIKCDGHFVLCESLIVFDDFADLFGLESLKDRGRLHANLQHRFFATIVCLHACKVPSAELIEIDGAIMIQIQVFEGGREIILGERVSKANAERCELLPINAAISIDIELIEDFFHLIFLFELIKVLHGANTTKKLLRILVIVQ